MSANTSTDPTHAEGKGKGRAPEENVHQDDAMVDDEEDSSSDEEEEVSTHSLLHLENT